MAVNQVSQQRFTVDYREVYPPLLTPVESIPPLYHINGMSNTITMDLSGRIVIPSDMRARFGFKGKVAEFEVEYTPEGIILRPKGGHVPAVTRKSGWVVFDSGAIDGEAAPSIIDPVEAIRKSREDRIASLSSGD